MLPLVLGLLAVTTAVLIGLCTKAPCRNQSSSVKRAAEPNTPTANTSPQKLPDSIPSVTPPIASNVDPSPQRSKQNSAGPAQKAANTPSAEPRASPCGSLNNTGTGTTGGDATTTPQSSLKNKRALADHSARGNNASICPEESNDLIIQTLTSGPDSLMERGQTTKTRADGSMCQFPSRKMDVKKASRGKRKSTVEHTAKTMQSPGKKTQIDKTLKGAKKAPQLPSSGNGKAEFTGQDPTSDRPEKQEKAKKDNNKTKEEKRSSDTKVATKASTALTITPVDSTQLSHTRKAPHK